MLKKHRIIDTSPAVAEADLLSFVATPTGVVLAANAPFQGLCAGQDDITGVSINSLFENPPLFTSGLNPFNLASNAAEQSPVWSEGLYPLILIGQAESILFNIQHVRGKDGRLYITGYGPAEKTGLQALDESQLPSVNIESTLLLQGPLPWTRGKSELLEQDWPVFAELTNDIQLVLGLGGEVVRSNDNARAVFWHGWDVTRPRDMMDTVMEEDRMAFRSLLQAMREEPVGKVQTLDMRHRKYDGEFVWYHWRFTRTAENTIAALGADITAVKFHSQKLKRREQQLKEAEAIARMGQWRWVIGTNAFDWSEEVYKIFGLEKNKFVPSIDNVQPLIHRRDLGIMYQAFQRAIIQQNDYEVVFRVQLASGALRHVRCEGRCELDENADVTALYGVMQDITAQVEHERALLEAKESAESAYAAKSRFLANMSHELRTPLNAIIGFSDLMQKQMLGPLGHERYADYVTAIKESGQHLLDLISDILDMSKIEAGKYSLHVEQVNVGKLMQLALHMMEGRAQESNIALSFVCDETENMVIQADRRAVMQILLNLLSNAVKFTEKNGAVTLSCKRLDSAIAITVRDTGIGIPANKLADVLRPFEQVSNALSRKHEGSGLGLAITKELIDLHGGSLSIDSKVGEGTAITVRLPLHVKQ